MGNKALDYKARDTFMIPPEDVTIIGLDTDDGPEHDLWDARLRLPVHKGLAQNIASRGFKSIITVTKDEHGRILVVDGRQRVRAARAANAVLRSLGDPEVQIRAAYEWDTPAGLISTMSVLNNFVQGDDLVDRYAKAKRLFDRCGDIEAVATDFGITTTQARIWLRLAALHPQLSEAMRYGACTQKEALELEGAGFEAQKAAGIRFLEIQEEGVPQEEKAPKDPKPAPTRRKRKGRAAILKALDRADGARATALRFLVKPEETTAADVLASEDPVEALKGILWALGGEEENDG